MSALRHKPLPVFVAECTLGKLAKWLRLSGFDTIYDSMPPDYRRLVKYTHSQNRQVLSRTRSVIRQLGTGRGLLIQYNAPIDQVRQVIKQYHIRQMDLKPLSRCSDCNRPLRQADQNILERAVPDYIRQQHERFVTCDQCHRVFWPGTHAARIAALIDWWFQT